MRPADIEHLAIPNAPTVRGDLVLVDLTRPDLADNDYRSTLRKVDLNGADQPWTHGERDTAPAISPDGEWVAFLRATRHSGRLAYPQVRLMPAAGGESRRLTELPLGADAPVWAPDSRRLALTARVPEPGRYGTANGQEEPVPPTEEAPRRITRFAYHVDDVGYLHDRHKRLFVIEIDGTGSNELSPLTDGETSVHDPAWLPGSATVLVAAARAWGRDETVHNDLYAVPIDGGAPRLAVRTRGNAAAPAVSADGVVWYFGAEFDGTDSVARNTGLWAARLDTDTAGSAPPSAQPRRMTDSETVDCVPDAGPPLLRDDRVLVAIRHRGAVELRAVPAGASHADLATLPVLLGERACVRAYTGDGATVVAVMSTPDSAGMVVVLRDGFRRAQVDYSEPLRRTGVVGKQELTARSADGYPVHGWLMLPHTRGPHPVLLVVHGGPFAAYDWGWFDEAQVYASAGYAVVLPNPRGSAGYGQQHARSIVGRFGTVDADDVLALLDAALQHPDLDEDRVGVQGGSYGGFMTSWLAAHHGARFRAAWSERGVNAWDSFLGSSDVGWRFVDAYIGADPDVQRAHSPLSCAHQINVPFAIAHSEHDWRVPFEQAQRMFVALKRHGVAVEMLVFPGEGHELSRSGQPRHRVQRFEAVLEWWARHLSVAD